MNRKDLLVAGGVAAVLTLGWYQFVWSSQGKAAAEARSDATAAQEQVTKLKGQVAALQRTKTELAASEGMAAQIVQAIPDTADTSALVKLLQGKAHDHNLTLTTLTNGKLSAPTQVDPAAAATVASEMNLSLSLFGKYDDIVTFVDDLSHQPRLLVVDALTLSPTQSAAKPGEPQTLEDITATVSLRAFSSAAPAPTGAAAAAATATTAPAAAAAATTATTAAAASSSGSTTATSAAVTQ